MPKKQKTGRRDDEVAGTNCHDVEVARLRFRALVILGGFSAVAAIVHDVLTQVSL